MKICSACDLLKSMSAFYFDKRALDGHTSECTVCRNAMNKKWREKNPHKMKEIRRAWQIRNPHKTNAYTR